MFIMCFNVFFASVILISISDGDTFPYTVLPEKHCLAAGGLGYVSLITLVLASFIV